MLTTTLVLAGALAAAIPPAATPPQDPAAELAKIAARSDGLVTTSVIGRSAFGTAIEVATVAAPGDTPPSDRPAILILAGLHGHHPLGTQLALDHLARFVDGAAASNEEGDGADDETRALLASHVFHVIPVVNPDGQLMGRIGNAKALDLDRDGRTDEDAPRDLDGDGKVTWMRWADPDGEWIVDPDEPRLMRKADTKKGERGTHRMELEAADTDGDGQRGEDDAQGVQIHRNFAHRHEEFDRRTGAWPVSEPSTKAVADFVFAHRNLVMAFVWDCDDNLLGKPKKGSPRGRTQLDGILEDDLELYETVGKLYREHTGRSGEVADRHDGSAWSWLNFQVGIPAFASDVWRVPTKLGEGDDAVEGERARLVHCLEVGQGFVDWHTYEHPELGEIELGGFVQMSDDLLMPAGAREELFAAHHAFLLDAIDRGPAVHIREFTAEKLGQSGAHRLRAVLINDGDLPAQTATANRTRRFSRPRWRLHLGGGSLVVGNDSGQTGNLAANGGKEELEWIVTGEPGTTFTLELDLDPVGGDRKEITR